MVDSGQPSIASIAFSGQRHRRLPVEVIERSDLLGRLRAEQMATPQRPSFSLVLLGRSGLGNHGVDFETVPVTPGRLVQVRPGQVQLWDTTSDFEATVVLARSIPVLNEAWFPGDRSYRDLDGPSLATAKSLADALVREQDRFTGSDSSTRLMNALFLAILALFDRVEPLGAVGPPAAAYLAFRAAVEADPAKSRNVRGYMAELGWSERTVNRACRQVTGKSAKALLDERCILEAKRLLAHTALPASGVGHRLGFSEATNFHKYFTRHAAQRPADFRAGLRDAGHVLVYPKPTISSIKAQDQASGGRVATTT